MEDVGDDRNHLRHFERNDRKLTLSSRPIRALRAALRELAG